MAITGTLAGTGAISGGLSGIGRISAGITVPEVVGPPSYEGTYEVTPGPVAVTLETAGMTMRQNVTINQIPSNYGLITWNGSTLTVS